MKRKVIPRTRSKRYLYTAGGTAGNTRWRLFRQVLLRNKQAKLRQIEPNLAEFQHKRKYLYRNLVELIITKETT